MLATSDLSPLDGLVKLESLDFRINGLTSVTLPPNLPGLRSLSLDFEYYLTNLVIPAPINLGQLDIGGFPREQVVVVGFWISPPTLSPQHATIAFRGAPGRRVHIQRSTDFRHWETLETVFLNEEGNFSYSAVRNADSEFYRITSAQLRERFGSYFPREECAYISR